MKRRHIFLIPLMAAYFMVPTPALSKSSVVAGWYGVREVRPGLWRVVDKDHSAFYVMKAGDRGLFIDSGMGFTPELGRALMKSFGIKKFEVLVTHAHLDHVGLNDLAERVSMSKLEWDKFVRQEESTFMEAYYNYFRDRLPWPEKVVAPKQRPWKPTRFLKAGETITFGSHEIKVVEVPGHTEGSLAFLDTKTGWFFIGDVIYDSPQWPHYLNFRDSSLAAYEKSLLSLQMLIDRSKPRPILLAAHGTAPLDAAFVSKMLNLIRQARAGKIKTTETFEPNAEMVKFLVRGWLYSAPGLSLFAKPNEMITQPGPTGP